MLAGNVHGVVVQIGRETSSPSVPNTALTAAWSTAR